MLILDHHYFYPTTGIKNRGQILLSFEQVISSWRQKPPNEETWKRFCLALSPLQFTPATLAVDETLWGGFWQGDVLAPGYCLPAVELSYLRHKHSVEGSTFENPQTYLIHLQHSLLQAPTSLWIGQFWQQSILCVVVEGWTIWLRAGEIVGAYADMPKCCPGYDLQAIKWNNIPSGFPEGNGVKVSPPLTPSGERTCVASATPTPSLDLSRLLVRGTEGGSMFEFSCQTLIEWDRTWSTWSEATKIDRLIHLHRAYRHLSHTKTGDLIVRWLEKWQSA